MQLSPHFTLDELCRSHTADRLGIDMTPTPAVEQALQSLATHVLEPLRDRLGRPVRVSSGYRPEKLNTAIGGASNSQHLVGEAADIEVDALSPSRLCHAILEMDIPFDQLILEFGWTHVSRRLNGPQRGEVLTAWRDREGRVHYAPGLPV